jgi:hypothetical protein
VSAWIRFVRSHDQLDEALADAAGRLMEHEVNGQCERAGTLAAALLERGEDRRGPRGANGRRCGSRRRCASLSSRSIDSSSPVILSMASAAMR